VTWCKAFRTFVRARLFVLFQSFWGFRLVASLPRFSVRACLIFQASLVPGYCFVLVFFLYKKWNRALFLPICPQTLFSRVFPSPSPFDLSTTSENPLTVAVLIPARLLWLFLRSRFTLRSRCHMPARFSTRISHFASVASGRNAHQTRAQQYNLFHLLEKVL